MSPLKASSAAEGVSRMPPEARIFDKNTGSQGSVKNPTPSSKVAPNGTPSHAPLIPAIVSRKSRRNRGRSKPKGSHLEKDKVISNDTVAATGNIDAESRQKQKKEPNIGSSRRKRSRKSKRHEGRAPEPIESTQGDVLAPRRSVWKTSSSLGGRFLHIDPVFAQDEKFLLLAHSRTLLVYSTTTSLLVRAMDLDDMLGDFIKSFILDPRDGNRVYIGTSMSRLFLWDWTCGRLLRSWRLLGLLSIESIASCADEETQSEESYGIVYVGGSGFNGSSGLWRFELLGNNSMLTNPPIYEAKVGSVLCIQVFNAGKIVAAAMGQHLLIGNKGHGGTPESKTWGTFRIYPMSFQLTCMDGYLPDGRDPVAKRPKQGNEGKLGDIVVGDQHGSLHLFHNSLDWREGWKREPVISRLHWHRSAVKSAKFALDGNYIVSGGSETVLVMWQLATNHKQFLPHLGATIENIVVSPKGSSYAVSLSDNSVMVLSTTELKPRANITGIQSRVGHSQRVNLLRLPCALHPTSPNRLLLATPSSQTHVEASLPYLQTYDIVSNRQISRQALTRTNATIINQGPDDYSIVEPNILHLAITTDGEWLATIDEWKPPKGKPLLPEVNQESAVENGDGQDSEIFLKFWKWDEKSKSWDLVTRVDSPHPSSSRPCAEEVFDLVATPKGHGFATVGADGSARIWKARSRTRSGIRVRGGGSELVTWGCGRVIRFSKGKRDLQIPQPGLLDGTDRHKREWWGRLAFSEDGSVMVVVIPDARGEDSIVHIVDATSGIIRHSISGLQVGKATGASILERHLVLLGSSKLLLWNLVNGQVEWEFGLDTLGAARGSLCHLAMDRHSQTFAIAVSTQKVKPKVFIFETRNPAPVYTTAFESGYPIMTLKASGTGKGYISLDTQARARWLSPVLAPHENAVQQTAEGGELEEVVEGENAVGVLSGGYLLNGVTSESNGDLTMYDEDDDEIVDRVVPRQALESIFGVAPSYAMGPLEEAYEKVLALFAKKPLGGWGSEGEEDEAGEDDMMDDE